MNRAARSVPIILANTYMLNGCRNESVADLPVSGDEEESQMFSLLSNEVFLFSNLRIEIGELRRERARLKKLIQLQNENIENLTILESNFHILKERTTDMME